MSEQERPQPVMNHATAATAVIVLVKAAVAMATAIGWIEWDTAQQAAMNAFVIAAVDATVVIFSAWQGHNLVTPLESPVDENGNPLVQGDWE